MRIDKYLVILNYLEKTMIRRLPGASLPSSSYIPTKSTTFGQILANFDPEKTNIVDAVARKKNSGGVGSGDILIVKNQSNLISSFKEKRLLREILDEAGVLNDSTTTVTLYKEDGNIDKIINGSEL